MNGYLRRKCVNYANYSSIHGESSTIIELANTETGRSWQNKLLRCLRVCWAQRIQVLFQSMGNLAGYCHSHGQYERAVQLGKQTVEM